MTGVSIDEADWPESKEDQNLITNIASAEMLQKCNEQQQSGMIAGKTLKEISELRSQFCVTFSYEFGSEQVAASNMWKRLQSKQSSVKNLSEEDAKEAKFLNKIYFTVQKYMCKNSEGIAPQQMPFRMYRILDLAAH